MENQAKEIEQEEIIKAEQYQADSSPAEDQQLQDDSEYTEDEVEYADGDGTQLDEELGVPERDDVDDDYETDLDDSELEDDEDQ